MPGGTVELATKERQGKWCIDRELTCPTRMQVRSLTANILGVRGSDLGRRNIFLYSFTQIDCRTNPAFCSVGTGGKASGGDAGHLSPYSAEVKSE